MNDMPLFRPEVLASRRNKNYGAVSINIPIQYKIATIIFLLLALLVILFLIFGEFSEKFLVNGYLESTKGVSLVYPHKNGVVVRQFFKQGDDVKKGQALFLIDTTFDGLVKNDHDDMLAYLEKKKSAIASEIEYKTKHLQGLKQLLEKKYISLTTYNAKRDELVALEHQNTEVDAEIMNHKHQQSYYIRSPIDGLISNVMYQEGQRVNVNKPLMKILPSHADLLAKLFVPVHQSGFLHPKNKVIIRLDAYPYERFGTAKATIDEISHSILTDEEEDKPIRVGQPYYKLTALLDKQYVNVYGKEKKIQHGMTISAVIVSSKRKVWQWILDPIYSFYGGVFL